MLKIDNTQTNKDCIVTKVKVLWNYIGNDLFYNQKTGFKCDIKNTGFSLNEDNFNTIENNIKKYIKENKNFKFWRMQSRIAFAK